MENKHPAPVVFRRHFNALLIAVGKPIGELTECHIRGIAVTTFGVDGALVDKQGNLLYPIISWKCPRTAAVMDNIEQLISDTAVAGCFWRRSL